MFVNSLPNDVTWFSSSQFGAPQMMGGSNGDLLKVLDACLTNGFGSKSVLTIDIDGDAVTLGFGVGHGYLERQRVLVSGANDPLLNGNHRIVSMTNNTVTLNIAGVSDTTGTITAKVAPLGFESMFGDSDALRRAYRSTSSASSKRVLFLDMTYPASSGYHATAPAKRATVSVCEGMDVLGVQIGSLTDGINQFATNPNGSLFWHQKRGVNKRVVTPNTATPWKIIGNSDFFYFIVGWHSDANFDAQLYCDVFGFGEFAKLGDSTLDATYLSAVESADDNTDIAAANFGATFTGGTLNPSIYCMVGATLSKINLSVISSADSVFSLVSGNQSMPYPNSEGASLFTQPIRVGSGNQMLLGVMPSILFVENKVASGGTAYDSDVVDDVLLASVHYKSKDRNKLNGYYAFYLGD